MKPFTSTRQRTSAQMNPDRVTFNTLFNPLLQRRSLDRLKVLDAGHGVEDHLFS